MTKEYGLHFRVNPPNITRCIVSIIIILSLYELVLKKKRKFLFALVRNYPYEPVSVVEQANTIVI